MPKKDWTDLLVRQLTDAEKDKLEQVGNLNTNKVLHIPNIIGGKKLHIETILNYLNYVGDRDGRKPINFIVMTVEQFESDDQRHYLVRHWSKLSGVAIVQFVRTHFLSVFLLLLIQNT
mmetsp:Transcript_20937/g.34547  ORF Transcript_20937/g.34547 Transcript_20937/m.34547 type:complete len:118 (+) Transcript_20937:88-441(+)